MGRMHLPDSGAWTVEAARYALLRRLAFAMRDQMVAHLHPIGVATQVMERRLREDTPDLAKLGEDMHKVRGFARAAVEVNLDVLTWIAPEVGQQVPLSVTVADCLEMLRSDFSYRGFQLRHAGASPQPVVRSAVRTLLPALLFALTDDAPAPGEVTVECAGNVLQLEVRAAAGSAPPAASPPYRVLAWKELDALARAEGVTLARSPTGARLQFGA